MASRNILRLSTFAVAAGTSYLVFRPLPNSTAQQTSPARATSNYAVAPNRSEQGAAYSEQTGGTGTSTGTRTGTTALLEEKDTFDIFHFGRS